MRKYLPQYPWKDLLHPEDSDEYFARWNESLRTGSTFEVQVRFAVPVMAFTDGFSAGQCGRSRPRRPGYPLVGWLHRRPATNGGRHATESRDQALQQSNADLEQFAYAASHDLQEPLRMVSIYSQLLREEYGGVLDRQGLSYIDFAVNGAKRMSNLLTALLTYSRVANAAAQLSPKADSLAAVNAALLNLSTIVEGTRASIEIGALPLFRS